VGDAQGSDLSQGGGPPGSGGCRGGFCERPCCPPCQEHSKAEEERGGSRLADVAEADPQRRRRPAAEAASPGEVMSGSLTSRSRLRDVADAVHAVGSFWHCGVDLIVACLLCFPG